MKPNQKTTHSSLAEDGETLGYNEVVAENLKLKDAIKMCASELEIKKRALEIEAALEKVRSKTMGMKSSDELGEVSFLLDTQVRALGILTRGCAFNIYGEGESKEWFSSAGGTLPPYNTPRENVFLRYYEAGQRGESIYIEEFLGDDCAAHYEYLCSLPGSGEGLKKYKESGGTFPENQIDHAVYFKYGYLLFITLKPVPEAHDIFKRFAQVFEQTYTRFLDLQKAEKQAIQATIDLEKIKEAKKLVETTLIKLKATQAQLIQSEKMASLGELTAGIAHEIQNPLNFVNNFSEVSTEMIDELNEEMANGDLEEVKAIAQDLKENLSKITHHGKRASNIVKGMLEHSRKNNGQKELTDINNLADEYLRLAYHGLRAKDRSFNADFKSDFDPNLPKVEVVSQDIGRVVLNLIHNAFQAVDEKAKSGVEGYKPLVQVATRTLSPASGGHGEEYPPLAGAQGVEITISDNGPGIPEEIKDKIFQPFFTTKPTGKGTGLGLSLAYDIVKAHGGELKVESKKGIGTTFSIHLPIN